MMKVRIFACFFLFFSVPCHSKMNWTEAPLESTGLNGPRIEKLFQYLFDKKAGYNTDGIVLIKDGKLVKEQYANGYAKNKTHRIWSASKSVTNTLIGIAVKNGILTLDSKIKSYYPTLSGEGSNDLTLDHLMKMSSGIDWQEFYEENPFASDVIKMLYIYKYKDMAGYTASRPVKFKPGSRFHYSSGETNLIMGVLKKSLSLYDYDNFPWTQLFDKLDIKTATWERDGSGVFVGSSYLYLSPRDLAKIGQLYLDKGKWQSEQIVTSEWVKYSTSVNSAYLNTEQDEENAKSSYGAHWWLNAKTKKGQAYHTAPENIFMALGHHGQILAVFPDQRMIFVRAASDKEGQIDRMEIFRLLMESIK